LTSWRSAVRVSYIPFMQLDSLRLTVAEVLACAVCDLFPETELVAAQVTHEGFFCDFESAQPIDEQALPLIEERMRGLIKADLKIDVREMMRENAAEWFRHLKRPLQVEKALESAENTLFVMHMGKFCALVNGKLLPSTGPCRAFKLLEIGREGGVLRIRGTACADLPSLKLWLKKMKAAKKRDHRLLGRELFLSAEEGWCWLPKGVALREKIFDFWREAVEREGYQRVETPAMSHAWLFSVGKYHLPVRFAEWADRFEPQEELEGLFRTQLTRGDALHLFAAPEQALDLCISSLQFFDKTLKIFSFEAHWALVDSRPVHSPVRQADWRQAVQLLLGAAEGAGLPVEKSSQKAGEWGPHLEMRVADALGREWAVASWGVNLGVNLAKQMPVMFSGSLISSLERLVALALENGIDLNLELRRAKAV
jgi:threonyl-tRNA synthetase